MFWRIHSMKTNNQIPLHPPKKTSIWKTAKYTLFSSLLKKELVLGEIYFEVTEVIAE